MYKIDFAATPTFLLLSLAFINFLYDIDLSKGSQGKRRKILKFLGWISGFFIARYSVRIKSLKTFFLSFLERSKNEFVSLFSRRPLKGRHWKSGGSVRFVLGTHTLLNIVEKAKLSLCKYRVYFTRKKREEIHEKFTKLTLCLLFLYEVGAQWRPRREKNI